MRGQAVSDWVFTNWTSALMVIVSAIVVYAILIGLTRLSGVRSFSKMSSFDFAITIATGSVAASIIVMKDPPIVQGAVALGILYAMQMSLAALRKRSKLIERIVDNQPRLIMCGREIHEDQMKKAKITHDDLFAKLREANVTQFDQVHAVIAETTGDISVLHGPRGTPIEPDLLRGVIGGDRYNPHRPG